MSNLNRVQLIGRLGADPEVRSMPNGTPVANLSIATSERWKDRQSGEQQERTEWHRVALFNRLAEVAGEYLGKGDLIYIEGSLRTRKWQDKDGKDRFTTEVIGRELLMLSTKRRSEDTRQTAPRADSGSTASSSEYDFDDSIPF